MFEHIKSFNFEQEFISLDNFSSIKLIKFLDDNLISFVVPTDNIYKFYKITLEGQLIQEIEFMIDDYLLDYLFIGEKLYIVTGVYHTQFKENLLIYMVYKDKINFISSIPRTSYQHDMDYFYIFSKNGEFRLLLICHTRLYLYTIDKMLNTQYENVSDEYSCLIELSFIDGYKWFINSGYAVNIKDNKWDIYDTNLKLVKSFTCSHYSIDWLGIVNSLDNSIIAIAGDSADEEQGILCVYDVKNDSINIHIQRYGYYSVGIIGNNIFTSLVSIYSDIGGIMLFDKNATLKYAHIKDEQDSYRNYALSPLFYQALSIEELQDSMGLISTENMLFIIDISCRVVQNLPFVPYENYALNSDRTKLVLLKYDNNGLNNQKMVSVNLYQWMVEPDKRKKANILNINLINRY